MEEYSWPGNIRQLQHMMERLTILAPGGRIDGAVVQAAIEQMDSRDHGSESLADTETEQIRACCRRPPTVIRAGRRRSWASNGRRFTGSSSGWGSRRPRAPGLVPPLEARRNRSRSGRTRGARNCRHPDFRLSRAEARGRAQRGGKRVRYRSSGQVPASGDSQYRGPGPRRRFVSAVWRAVRFSTRRDGSRAWWIRDKSDTKYRSVRQWRLARARLRHLWHLRSRPRQ